MEGEAGCRKRTEREGHGIGEDVVVILEGLDGVVKGIP